MLINSALQTIERHKLSSSAGSGGVIQAASRVTKLPPKISPGTQASQNVAEHYSNKKCREQPRDKV